VSVEAISWALNLAPVPAGRGGQPSTACKFVLVGLANPCRAGRDGRVPVGGHAGPVHRPVRADGRTCLDRLGAAGIIGPCDPEIVAARIKRADRRPKGWDLDLSLVRDGLTGAGLAALEHQFPGLAARVAEAARPGAGGAADGLPSPHPAGTVDNWPDGGQPLPPASGTGCNQRTGRVQPAQPRGAAVAPEPPVEPSREPSAARARGRQALPAAGGSAAGGERAGEFFEALGRPGG
jgi:hypothetical protein